MIRIERPKINPQIYEQLISDKEVACRKLSEESLLKQMMQRKRIITHQKNILDLYVNHPQKIHSKWIINLKFRLKFRDYIEKNIGSTLQDLEFNGLKWSEYIDKDSENISKSALSLKVLHDKGNSWKNTDTLLNGSR